MKNNVPLLLKVAELYYMQGLNQSDIAEIIGVSRPSISRLLDEAREVGIVKISVEAPFQMNRTLSEQLIQTFALKDAIVIQDLGDYTYNMDMIGKVAAHYIAERLDTNSILGLSWGKATEMLVDYFPELTLPHSLTLQLNGSLGSTGNRKDGNELVFRMSKKLGGAYKFFNAPAYVDSQRLQQELKYQGQIAANVDSAHKMSIAYNGIGNMQAPYNTLFAEGLLTNQDLSAMLERGAVGSIMGRLYDLEGQEILYQEKFPVANDLSVLKATPLSIGAVASKERSQATFGALKGDFINVLICDESLANELLLLQQHPHNTKKSEAYETLS